MRRRLGGGLALAWAIVALLGPPAGAGETVRHGQGPTAGAGGRASVRVPETVVYDQDERRLAFYRDLVQGRTVAINFIFTTCTTVCSPLTATFRQLQRELGGRVGEDIGLISVSVDPVVDTPARLKAYAEKFGAGPGWTFVTGRKPDIDRLLEGLGAATADKNDHTPLVLVGNEAAGYWTRVHGLGRPTDIAEVVREAADRAPAASRRALPRGRSRGLTTRGTPPAAAALTLAAAGVPEGGLSATERRGRQIYRKGEAKEGAQVTAKLGGSDLELPASLFACANCHGLTGEGTEEGGLRPPPMDWGVLTAPSTSPLTGLRRGPYDAGTLVRAIGEGLDPAGRPLHSGMPRYRMAGGQTADLIAYLRVLGGEIDVDPGVSRTALRVGAALPLTGALAPIGEDIRVTLAAYFEAVNARGGVYGRRFELVVEDSRGEAGETVEATRRLVELERVFALVGSFEPSGSTAPGERLRQAEVPLVGPVTLSPPRSRPPNPYVFYLLPGFGDQARVLVDFVAARALAPGGPGGARLAVVYADGELEGDALGGLRAQAARRSLAVVAEQGYPTGRFSPARALEAVAASVPDAVFFFGSPDDVGAFAREMERAGLTAALLSPVAMVGRAGLALPPGIAGRTYLAYPSVPPERADLTDLLTVMRSADAEVRSYPFQSVAYAAARVLTEATKRAGRRVSRAGLVAALEGLRGFRAGVLPPISFDPNRRIGAVGAYVVGVDVEAGRYVPLTDWLVPEDGP